MIDLVTIEEVKNQAILLYKLDDEKLNDKKTQRIIKANQ